MHLVNNRDNVFEGIVGGQCSASDAGEKQRQAAAGNKRHGVFLHWGV